MAKTSSWDVFMMLTAVLIVLMMLAGTTMAQVPIICQHYDNNECKANSSKCEIIQEQCPLDHDECYAFYLLHNVNGVNRTVIQKKGCWNSDKECREQTSCTNKPSPWKNPRKPYEGPNYFCCCKDWKAICNTQVFYLGANLGTEYPEMLYHEWEQVLANASNRTFVVSTDSASTEQPSKSATPKTLVAPVTVKPAVLDELTMGLIIGSVILTVLIGLILALIIYRRYHGKNEDKTAGDVEGAVVMQPLMSKEYENQDGMTLLRNVQYIERKSTGRYGEVWKGKINEAVVAVKVTQLAEVSSWSNEVNMYKKFLLNPHPNILRCLMSSERVAEGRLLLVFEYHPLGSLMEVLKGRVINLDEGEKIMCTMLAGMAYLHDSDGKPSIAHRDFKSTNVLVKDGYSACIADFGLATAFEPDERIGDKHGQVGTRRYMAPELLEGAISLNVASFLRVDIYACGLVLWEILSRTQLTPEEPVGVFRLPFEEELGLSPSNEAVQMAVVHRRVRPTIKDFWKKFPRTSSVCLTIEECWDADPEARPSASCLYNRARKSADGEEDSSAVRYDDSRDSAYCGSSPVHSTLTSPAIE